MEQVTLYQLAKVSAVVAKGLSTAVSARVHVSVLHPDGRDLVPIKLEGGFRAPEGPILALPPSVALGKFGLHFYKVG